MPKKKITTEERELKIFYPKWMEDLPFPELLSYKNLVVKPETLKDINKSEGVKLTGIEEGAMNLANHTTDDLSQGLTNKYDDQDASNRAKAGLTTAGYVAKELKGTVLPATIPNEAGLMVTQNYMGYKTLGTTADAWKSYIGSDGTFYFNKGGSNYIQWDGVNLIVRGNIYNTGGQINANYITAGTLTGRTVQTATSGQRVVIESGASGLIRFYSSVYETATFFGSGSDIMISTSQPSGKIFLSVGTSGAIVFAQGGTIKSYIDALGDIHIGAGNAILDNSSNTAQLAINKHFVPSLDNSFTLGGTGRRWSDFRAITATFSGSITCQGINFPGNYSILMNNVGIMDFIDYTTYAAIVFKRGSAGCDLLPYADNYGQIGYNNRRWARIRGVTIVSGDFVFENKFRITEEGENALAIYNQKGQKILIIDEYGNIKKVNS